MRVAVVGHVEWVEFAIVDRVPTAGEIIHAAQSWSEPAGGGAVAAVQLARLAGAASLFTALGDDPLGERVQLRLAELGVELHAAQRSTPTRRAFTFLDAHAERTITTLHPRMFPSGADALPWTDLAEADGVYVTAGDAEAFRAARAAHVLVATPRAGPALDSVAADAVVYSAHDATESDAVAALTRRPPLLVATEGSAGGSWKRSDGTDGRWSAASPPGPLVDLYGAGDSFAAGLTFALADGQDVEQAVDLAARCGAWCASGAGPYAGQLRAV
ncbi:MAG: PfkB family carbohydrate kinase [Solirubrobacteraceae bacterium]|jgi:ribokinase